MSSIQVTRNGKIVTMHRCAACWFMVDKTDNGYVPLDTPITHHPNCMVNRLGLTENELAEKAK